MQTTKKHLALIVSVAIIVLFTNLGVARLWDRDEPRNAGAALEMMNRGDMVVPWFNDELRAHKPVLLYWLIISAYSVFGVNEFAARFWPAFLGLGTAICTYFMGRRLFSADVGLWAAIILVTSLMFDVAAHACTPDSLLIFFVTASLTAFVIGTTRTADPTKNILDFFDNDEPADWENTNYLPPLNWTASIVMYLLMGLAVLSKGPIGLILPVAVMGMFLLIARLPKDAKISSRLSSWPILERLLRPFEPMHFVKTVVNMHPLTAIACVLAVALPWYWLVHIRSQGEFTQGFFRDHNFQRAMEPSEGHRGSAFIFYPLTILVGFFPWSVFLGPTIAEMSARIRRSTAGSMGFIFCACWVCVWVGAFSLASTKLPSYITPCYPALAIMTAAFINAWCQRTELAHPDWMRWSLGIMALVGAVILVGVPAAIKNYLPGEEGLAVIGLAPLLGGLMAWAFMEQGRRWSAGATFATSAVILTTMLFGYAMLRVDQHQQNHLLLKAISQRSANAEVGSYNCLEPSWMFYGRRPVRDLYLGKSFGSSTTEVQPPPAKPWGYKPSLDLVEFLTSAPNRFVITTRKELVNIQSHLPPDATIIAEAPLFLKKEQLVVLARTATVNAVAHPTLPNAIPRR